MAKVILGPLITDARCSVGNTVFTKNRAGNVTRLRVKGANPKSTKQIKSRKVLKDLNLDWVYAMTDAQRAAWTIYAETFKHNTPLAPGQTLTGYDAFVQANGMINYIIGGFIPDPPTDRLVTDMGPLEIVSSSAAAHSLVLSFTPAVDGNHVLPLFMAPQLSPGHMTHRNRFQFLFALGYGDSPPIDIGPYYEAMTGPISNPHDGAWGPLVAGKKVWIRYYAADLSKGVRTPLGYTSTVVGP